MLSLHFSLSFPLPSCSCANGGWFLAALFFLIFGIESLSYSKEKLTFLLYAKLTGVERRGFP